MRSTERAQEIGEVFTPDRTVREMLDLIPDMFEHLDKTFLEPACGDGNFLVEILERKLNHLNPAELTVPDLEFGLLQAVASIYGVDISADNVADARDRLFEVITAFQALSGDEPTPGFHDSLRAVLGTNIILADMLTQAAEIVFVEYRPIDGHKFERVPFHFQETERDLFFVDPEPLSTVHYLELGRG